MSSKPTKSVPKGYDASSIQNLAPRDHVRLRPSSYVGGTGSSALVHLVDELLANAADEALAGHAKTVWLTIAKDNRVTVADDGRGVPIGETELATGKKIPTVQAAFTEMLTGGKYADEGAYEGGAGGMNGMGAKAVVFLSRETSVDVRRDGQRYTQVYRNGKKGSATDTLLIEAPVIAKYAEKAGGTSVTFLYDDSVFDADAHLDGDRIKRKCYNLSRLVPGLTVHFEDIRVKSKETFISKLGLPDFVKDLNDGESVLFKEIIAVSERKTVEDANGQPVPLGVEASFQPTASESVDERGTCFTNLVHNPDGGTHLSGFRKGLTRALNAHCKAAGLFKGNDGGFDNSDVMAGLAFALSIRANASSVQYESQTKKQLTSAWVDGAVANIVDESVRAWLSDHPSQGKLWFTYLSEIRKARLAMLAERRAVKAKVGGGGLDPLISKLARETTKDPSKAEIYWVEGDSAGGNAKSARDRRTQAVLPFRGKMLNVLLAMEKGRAEGRKKALENEDVRRIATAIETGMGVHFDVERLRYHKIILMADADADGGHIIMLWLGAIWMMFPELIRRSHVYIAIPPLYSIYDYKTKKRSYAYNEVELKAWTKGRAKESYNVTRFKGLGEMMAEDLERTAMNPATRRLRQITVADLGEVKALMDSLMGNRPAERRAFMDHHARGRTTREDVAVD